MKNGELRMKNESSKFQVPSSKEVPSPKLLTGRNGEVRERQGVCRDCGRPFCKVCRKLGGRCEACARRAKSRKTKAYRKRERQSRREARPDLEAVTCADTGGVSRETVGCVLGVSGSVVSETEARALAKLRADPELRRLWREHLSQGGSLAGAGMIERRADIGDALLSLRLQSAAWWGVIGQLPEGSEERREAEEAVAAFEKVMEKAGEEI